MKKMLRVAVVLAAVAMLGCLVSGCEGDGKSNWKFKNESSHRVYVAPNGQSWAPAMINPGGSVTVDWDERIQYVYTPSSRVAPHSADGNVIIFRNR